MSRHLLYFQAVFLPLLFVGLFAVAFCSGMCALPNFGKPEGEFIKIAVLLCCGVQRFYSSIFSVLFWIDINPEQR
ncbi:MAG: hypothetical protein D3917_18840 [Candidatus Electrothrix sp. AX5]|nr:hypothetical protein [Candidatus Electrothrix sp. AX5]